jgi:hypothetical protein
VQQLLLQGTPAIDRLLHPVLAWQGTNSAALYSSTCAPYCMQTSGPPEPHTDHDEVLLANTPQGVSFQHFMDHTFKVMWSVYGCSRPHHRHHDT